MSQPDLREARAEILRLLENDGDFAGIGLAVNPSEMDRLAREQLGLDDSLTVGLYTYVEDIDGFHKKSEPFAEIGHCSIGWLKRFQLAKELARAALDAAPQSRECDKCGGTVEWAEVCLSCLKARQEEATPEPSTESCICWSYYRRTGRHVASCPAGSAP